MSPRRRFEALALVALLGGCRCGDAPEPRAYDVGVPLEDLPRAQASALAELVAGPVLLYAQASDGRALQAALTATAPVQALARSGALSSLTLSGPASAVSALVQRLNDLSRSPIGDEAILDLLEGPLALGVRTGPRGVEVLLAKSLSPRAQGALRLAQMLEAVHPSTTELRVERHLGLPVRTLRLQGGRRLAYVVLRDRLLLSTDGGWLLQALDVALGARPPSPPSSTSAMRSLAAASAFAVLDAAEANRSGQLGALSRALSGLDWLALRWDGANRVELGARRAQGLFGKGAPPLPLPPGTALALAREATLGELLALPPRTAVDGGAPLPEPGALLLQRVESQLGPGLEGHLLYALGRAEAERAGPSHLLLLGLRAPGVGLQAMDHLAPALFRAGPTRHDELMAGARCEGAGPALCWSEAGPLLGLSTSPAALRAALDPARRAGLLAGGPLAIYLDPLELVLQLGLSSPASRKRGAPAELDPVLAALRGTGPLVAELEGDGAEAWGTFVVRDRRTEPGRDGGFP